MRVNCKRFFDPGKKVFHPVPAAGEQLEAVTAVHGAALSLRSRLIVRARVCSTVPTTGVVSLRGATLRVSSREMTRIDCIPALKALGELSRLRIMRLLLKEQAGVNAIAERLGMSQYNVSKHLRILKEAGLVEMRKQGQQRLYAVVPSLKSQLAASRNVLDLGCCTFRFDKLPR